MTSPDLFFTAIQDRLKTSDTTLMLLGASMFARTHHNTPLTDATSTPPLIQSKNVAEAIWRLLAKNPNVQYRRLDHSDWQLHPTFQAIGTVPFENAGWTASESFPGITFVNTEPQASARIKVPAGYRQCELIYRSLAEGDRIKIETESEGIAETVILEARESSEVFNSIFNLRQKIPINSTSETLISISKFSPNNHPIGLWGIVYWNGSLLRLINCSKGSHSSKALFRYFPVEVGRHKPNFLLYQLPLGSEFMIKDNPLLSSEEYTRKIFTLAFENNIEVCTMIVNQGKRTPENQDHPVEAMIAQFKSICIEFDIPFIDVFTAFQHAIEQQGLTFDDLTADGIHPSDRGAQIYGAECSKFIHKT